MCINLETSILAFGLGEASGLYLATRDSIEKKLIGLFVMFYSLVQLLEAFIYYYGKSANEIYSRLLLLNLGFQGLVFFLLMSYCYKINSFYLIITGIISLGILVYSFGSSFKKAELTNECMKWIFMENNFIKISLSIMYTTMFCWILNHKENIYTNTNNNFIFNSGLVLLLTYLFSEQIKFNCNIPSIWCLTSAISAPIFTLL
jgi:hypothetical protein